MTAARLVLTLLGALRWCAVHALDIAMGAGLAVILIVLLSRCDHHDVDVDRGPPALRYLATCPV